MVIIRSAGHGVPQRPSGEPDGAGSEPPPLTGYDAALAAYRASTAAGRPISGRQLAARHAISRRQAGHIIATVTRGTTSNSPGLASTGY